MPMTQKEKINNAYRLAIGPILTLDDYEGRYYTSYVGEKIAALEKNEGVPPRVIAYFPATPDGLIAAERFVDSLNGSTLDDVDLSFEKTSTK